MRQGRRARIGQENGILFGLIRALIKNTALAWGIQSRCFHQSQRLADFGWLFFFGNGLRLKYCQTLGQHGGRKGFEGQALARKQGAKPVNQIGEFTHISRPVVGLQGLRKIVGKANGFGAGGCMVLGEKSQEQRNVSRAVAQGRRIQRQDI